MNCSHLLKKINIYPWVLVSLSLLRLACFFPCRAIIPVELLHGATKTLGPEGLRGVFVQAELLVQPADGALAKPVFQVLQEVGRMFVAPVPRCEYTAK